ncbi:hypothetical protein ACE6H2_024542 [Prunus campanulata]
MLLFRHKLCQLREDMDIKPEAFASLLFFMRKDEDKPFFCTMDSTGAKEPAKDCVVAGTASESLYGSCETMNCNNSIFSNYFTREPEEFFEIVSQALLSSVDRDCLSGWGGHVYVV